MALDQGAVLPTGLVGTLNAALAPICPVNVVLVLGESKGVREVISNHLTVLTYKDEKVILTNCTPLPALNMKYITFKTPQIICEQANIVLVISYNILIIRLMY